MSKMKATVLIVISILLIASLEVHGSNRKRKLKFNYIDDDDEPPRKKEKTSASNPYEKTTNTNSGKVRNQPTEKKESLLDDFLKILEETKDDHPHKELTQHIENRKKLIDEHPQAGRTQPGIDSFQEFAEINVHQIQNDPNQNLLNVINHELLLRNKLAQLKNQQK
eukprot:998041_1